MPSIDRIARLLVVSATMCGCTKPSPCPRGAALFRLPDGLVDGGTAALCRTPRGTLDGPVTLTWDGIRPRLTGRFEQGRPVDAFTWWHANGKKRASYAFSAAAPAGTWETWYPNGQPQWQVRFQDGVPHGSVREARDDGTKRFEGHFTAGQRSGEWTAWYRSGTRAGEGHYAEDRPAGRWAVWWKSGASAGVREGRGDWKYAAADGGVLSADRYEVARHPPSADPVGSPGDLVFGEGRPVDEGPPEFVPPLTVPDHSARDGVFPWGSLHGVWFDEFLIELRLPRDDLD